MTDLDDTLLDGESTEETSGTGPSAAVLRVLASDDVKRMVEAAARAQVRARIGKAVNQAVDQIITEDLLAHVREDAGRLAGEEVEQFLSTGSITEDEVSPDETEEPVAAAQNYYPNVFVFFESFLVKVWVRPVGRGKPYKWCSRWFDHAEAVSRLQACWRAFEVLRLDPGLGPSHWWYHHADPCMSALTDSEGPFKRCEEHHQITPPLPADPIPAELLKHTE